MTLIKTSHNRRSFLKISSAAGGGLLLGFSALAGCKREVLEEEIVNLVLPEKWFEMSGFIKIGDNGVVTIMSPNPEIGQNIKTSMPMLVAEELDVDWEKVVVEQAGFDNKKYTRQVAGGSQSIRKGWESLRTAGATVRQVLLEAAAKKWEVSAGELTTSMGNIHHEASGKTMSYGEIASAAAEIEIPKEVKLKDPKDFKIIGTPIANVDGRGIVTGKPLFGMDYEEEGMLIAMVENAPAFGSKLNGFNKDEIKSMPGITDVVELNTDFLASGRMANTFAKRSMMAIVGESTWQVMKAKKALKADWSTVSGGENSSDHERGLTDLLNKSPKVSRKDGNPEKAFAEAAQVIEKTYSAPFLPHNTMAPMNFFAHVSTDKARFVGPIQTPEWTVSFLSEALDMPKENIDIMMTRMGGGFGRRLYGNFAVEAGLISKQIGGKPVKLIYSREDDMTNGTYRPAYKVKYRAALDADNTLTALAIQGAGIHGGPVWADRFPAGSVDNYLAADSSMDSNISTGAWRAPKSNFIAGAEQSFLDEVAEAAGKDPIDFRLELFDKAKNNPAGKDNDYDPERYAGVLKLVKEKSGWGSEMSGVHRGVAAYYCHNSYVAQVMDISMVDGYPKIQKVWCAVDCGVVVNPTGAKNQIEGGVIDGIGTAMYGGLTFENGVAQQSNFNSYQMIRHNDAPVEIETFFVDNGIDPTGLGEPGLPPIMGALANALYKATNKRFYNQPFNDGIEDLLG